MFKKIFFSILILAFDIGIYIVLGLLLMDYDDFYDESKGEYWSLESMTLNQKMIYFGINAWHLLNIILIIFILYKVFIHFKNNQIFTNLKPKVQKR